MSTNVGRAGVRLTSGAISTDSWPLRTVPAELVQSYTAEGFWTDASLGQVLAGGLSAHPSLAFIARSQIHPWAGTFAEVLDLARRVAGSLLAWGVGPGDVVAFQLPNWVEAAATFYATTMLGATVAPIVHFYGPREVGHILRESQARVLVSADRFGHLDWPSPTAARTSSSEGEWPEELRVIVDFPRTASGKVQKFVLRDRLRAGR